MHSILHGARESIPSRQMSFLADEVLAAIDRSHARRLSPSATPPIESGRRSDPTDADSALHERPAVRPVARSNRRMVAGDRRVAGEPQRSSESLRS